MDFTEQSNIDEYTEEIKQAEILLEQGEITEARVVLTHILNKNHTHYKAHLLLGQSYLEEQNYSRAIEIYQKVKENFPLIPDGYYFLGSIYNILGHSNQALEELNIAIGLNPHLIEAVIGKAVALCEVGDSEKALKELDQSLENITNNQDIILIFEAKAMILLEYRREEGRAKELANRILELDHENIIAKQIISIF